MLKLNIFHPISKCKLFSFYLGFLSIAFTPSLMRTSVRVHMRNTIQVFYRGPMLNFKLLEFTLTSISYFETFQSCTVFKCHR